MQEHQIIRIFKNVNFKTQLKTRNKIVAFKIKTKHRDDPPDPIGKKAMGEVSVGCFQERKLMAIEALKTGRASSPNTKSSFHQSLRTF